MELTFEARAADPDEDLRVCGGEVEGVDWIKVGAGVYRWFPPSICTLSARRIL